MNTPTPPHERPAGRTYTHLEAIAAARAWMVENYGAPKSLGHDEKELWMQRFGMLVDFLDALDPPEKPPVHFP